MIIEPELRGSYYYFTMNGLTAVQMNDLLESTLYATRDGKTYSTETDSYSIALYAYNQLEKAAATEALKTLCAELLRYGAKAQIMKAYRTDALADASMTGEHRELLSDLEAVVFGNNNNVLNDLTDPAVTWAGKSLVLDSKVTLRMIANLSNYTGNAEDLTVRVSYVNMAGEEVALTLTDPVVYNEGKQQYAFDFSQLLSAELRTVVSAAVYEGDRQVSPTMEYSPDTYGNSKTGDLLILCQALMAYSDAALSFFRQ